MGEVGSRSRVRSSTRSQARSWGGEGPRRHEARQPAGQGDVDAVLVGRRVSIAVVVGDRVARVVGTITVMGRFWVVVNVEESELPMLQGTVYLNKGSVVAYMPIPDNNPKS